MANETKLHRPVEPRRERLQLRALPTECCSESVSSLAWRSPLSTCGFALAPPSQIKRQEIFVAQVGYTAKFESRNSHFDNNRCEFCRLAGCRPQVSRVTNRQYNGMRHLAGVTKADQYAQTFDISASRATIAQGNLLKSRGSNKCRIWASSPVRFVRL